MLCPFAHSEFQIGVDVFQTQFRMYCKSKFLRNSLIEIFFFFFEQPTKRMLFFHVQKKNCWLDDMLELALQQWLWIKIGHNTDCVRLIKETFSHCTLLCWQINRVKIAAIGAKDWNWIKMKAKQILSKTKKTYF